MLGLTSIQVKLPLKAREQLMQSEQKVKELARSIQHVYLHCVVANWEN